MELSECTIGTRVKLNDKASQQTYDASDEEWATNPKTGTIITIKGAENTWPNHVLVEFDVEWLYNKNDLFCSLMDFEIVLPEELDFE
jgi:hypothetical protein